VEATTILRDLVSKLLTRLGPEDRVVLTLLEMDGMSVRDVADLTGWSVAKVKIRAHRARLALRRVLRKFV
jgi:RNA polymerase sigma-70 factor (ECF subfamily)